jgi:hypothetical protein
MNILLGSVKENSLALLSDDYISPLLLNTLMREDIPALIRGKRLKGELERFYPGLKVLNKAEAMDIISKENNRLLMNSEDFLSCLIDNAPEPSKAERLKVLSDKRQFREMEREAYPDYFFMETESDRLKDAKIKLPPGRSYIVKPSSGPRVIGAGVRTGVRMLKDRSDLEQVAKSLTQDNMSLDPGSFLIEEYIRGDEFACDAYISPRGEPVVLGIYAHPLRDPEDFRDIVYFTSAGIMRKMLPRVSDFLRRLSNQTGLQGIPLHVEFRLKENRLMPIEVDPLRFGSFSIPDLVFFAFGLNPYKYYYNYLKPEWERIISQAGEEIYFRVLARMPKEAEGKTPDHEEFADTVQDMVGYCKLDTNRYPAFSIAFGRTKDMDSVLKYLNLDFRMYLS